MFRTLCAFISFTSDGLIVVALFSVRWIINVRADRVIAFRFFFFFSPSCLRLVHGQLERRVKNRAAEEINFRWFFVSKNKESRLMRAKERGGRDGERERREERGEREEGERGR